MLLSLRWVWQIGVATSLIGGRSGKICVRFLEEKTYSVSRSVVGGTDIGATLGYADYEPTHVTLPWAEDVFNVLEAWRGCEDLPLSH